MPAASAQEVVMDLDDSDDDILGPEQREPEEEEEEEIQVLGERKAKRALSISDSGNDAPIPRKRARAFRHSLTTAARDVRSTLVSAISTIDTLTTALQTSESERLSSAANDAAIRALSLALECGLCYEPLKQPYVMSCGHTACGECLSLCWRSKGAEAGEPARVEEREKKCPWCDKPVRGRPAVNWVVKGLMEAAEGREVLALAGVRAKARQEEREDPRTAEELWGGIFPPDPAPAPAAAARAGPAGAVPPPPAPGQLAQQAQQFANRLRMLYGGLAPPLPGPPPRAPVGGGPPGPQHQHLHLQPPNAPVGGFQVHFPPFLPPPGIRFGPLQQVGQPGVPAPAMQQAQPPWQRAERGVNPGLLQRGPPQPQHLQQQPPQQQPQRPNGPGAGLMGMLARPQAQAQPPAQQQQQQQQQQQPQQPANPAQPARMDLHELLQRPAAPGGLGALGGLGGQGGRGGTVRNFLEQQQQQQEAQQRMQQQQQDAQEQQQQQRFTHVQQQAMQLQRQREILQQRAFEARRAGERVAAPHLAQRGPQPVPAAAAQPMPGPLARDVEEMGPRDLEAAVREVEEQMQNEFVELVDGRVVRMFSRELAGGDEVDIPLPEGESPAPSPATRSRRFREQRERDEREERHFFDRAARAARAEQAVAGPSRPRQSPVRPAGPKRDPPPQAVAARNAVVIEEGEVEEVHPQPPVIDQMQGQEQEQWLRDLQAVGEMPGMFPAEEALEEWGGALGLGHFGF